MPKSSKNTYPEFEVAISTVTKAPLASGERAEEGDIVVVRRPHHCIGIKESGNRLWIRLEGLEEEEIARLTDPLNFEQYDKRRYCIPLDRLKAQDASLDEARVKDKDDIYQPYVGIYDSDDLKYSGVRKPLSVHGLIFDKLTGAYL